MKYAGELRVPGLGIVVPVEVELTPAPEAGAAPELIDDAALRARWKCSARTLKRLRDQRRLPYLQPSARRFLYELGAVREYERQETRGAHRRAVGVLA